MDDFVSLDALSVGASAAAGGLFGVIGAALGRVVGVFERREAYKHERAEWAHTERLHELQMKAGAAETENELAVVAAQGSYAGLTESLATDAASAGTSYRWVEAVRALVRPTLTPLLWLLYLAVFLRVTRADARIFLSAETADDLVAYFVSNVAFAATAATLWWFGDRAPRPKGLDRGGL